MALRKVKFSFQYLEFPSTEAFKTFLGKYKFDLKATPYQSAWKFSSSEGYIFYVARDPLTSLRLDGKTTKLDSREQESGYVGLAELALPLPIKQGTTLSILKEIMILPKKDFHEGVYFSPRLRNL